MQLSILQISLDSSAIHSHSSEVGTVTYIGCSTFQMAFPDSRTMPWSRLEKSIPKTQIIPHWQDTWNRLSFSDSQKRMDKWHNLRSNYMRERRKSKEKISGSGVTVKGNWPFHDVMNFLEYYLQRRTMEMFQRQQLQLKFHNGSRWNWNRQFWTTGRRKYNSWPENGRRVESKRAASRN
jgi:hypothetical protein